MAGPYVPPELYDIALPELFTLIAQQNPRRSLVQIIRDHVDAPMDSIRFSWAEVLQHAQIAATDLRNRWAEKQDVSAGVAAQPREPGSPPVVVGILANNGYELYANILASVLNRWTILLISPKNSPAAIEHLLRTSHSSLFVVEPANIAFGRTMEQAIPGLLSQKIVNLDQLVTGSVSSQLKPLGKEQMKKEMKLPVFYLHTSGSTGHPKIIPWSHEFLLSGIRARTRDRDEFIGLPLYCVPPIIHAAGIIAHFVYAPAQGNILNLTSSPTPKPPSASSLLAHLPFIQDGILILPPSILEDLLSLGPEPVKKVAEETKLVSYTGAPLNTTTGNALVAAGMKLHARYGSTEINCVSTHLFPKKPEDWQYVYFRDGYELHFLPIDDSSNLRELVIGPGPDSCPATINHDHPRGYATNDVWEPHPTVHNLWKHHSRKGNVTVLSNGEKSDNKQIEDLLLWDKHILHVQVFGAGRPMNGVVIQPTDAFILASVFLTLIQPTIEHANSILPKHSKLVPELVIVASPDRPFPTTDKGTVKKKETLDMFQREIQSAYDILEEGGAGSEWTFDGNVNEERDLKKFLRSAVENILDVNVSDEVDLFEHGLDSLLAILLRGAVLSVVSKTPTSNQPVPRNVVYTYPSINALTSYLTSRAVLTRSKVKDVNEERIRQSILKYSSNLVPHVPGTKVMNDKVVALSGSTGSVGSSMLWLLLGGTDVAKIFLLNRRGSESQEVRQARGFTARGLDPALLDTKKGILVYLDIDFSKRDLGLAHEDYKELRDSVTHIIHAAWHLNFNLILESYERVHIAGVRSLVDLALCSPHARPPRLTFLSTISAAAMYQGPTQEPLIGVRAGQVLVPEDPIDDPGIASDQGYGQSKYVSERVLVNAVEAGLRATIVRVGQLSGVTTNGAWAPTEYVPIMLRSSLTMGVVPTDLAPVRWVPSDIAASVIIKQAFHDSASRLEYFSIENPFPTPWNVLVQVLSAVSPKPLLQVTLGAWLEHIRISNPDTKDVPATKLLEFYERRAKGGQPTALAWEKSVALAPELMVGPIITELIEKYVRYQQERASQG